MGAEQRLSRLRTGLEALQRLRQRAEPGAQQMMHDSAAQRSDTEMYRTGIQRADAELEGQLTAIRAAADSGEITVRQAADKRIAAMEHHLTECRRLRERYVS